MNARYNAWVCGRSLDRTDGSNTAEGMDVCLLWVLCVVRVRDLCVGTITHPEDSYRVWWFELSVIVKLRQWGGPGPLGAVASWKTINYEISRKHMDLYLSLSTFDTKNRMQFVNNRCNTFEWHVLSYFILFNFIYLYFILLLGRANNICIIIYCFPQCVFKDFEPEYNVISGRNMLLYLKDPLTNKESYVELILTLFIHGTFWDMASSSERETHRLLEENA